MKKLLILTTLSSMIFLYSCSNSSKVNRFLDEYENVVKKWEKYKTDSMTNYTAHDSIKNIEISKKSKEQEMAEIISRRKNPPQIIIDNRQLCKKSDNLKKEYPVKKWDQSQIDRFQNLSDSFMYLQLEIAWLERFPRPYE